MSSFVVVRGSGSIGQRHARVFRQEGAEVSLWPVRDRGLGPDAVDEATGVRLLDDTSGPAALRDAFVVVATDTARHVDDAIEALDAGAATVLVEKPVAPTEKAANVLADHPRHRDVWVAAPLRAHEAFRHLYRHVGGLGQGGSAHVWAQSWLPDWRPGRDYRDSYSARRDEGGVLRDLVHEIDYASVLFGAPELVGASVATSGPLSIESEQAATLLWTGERVRRDGAARLHHPAPTRGVVVHSADGLLHWDVVRATVRHTTPDGEVTEHVFDADLDRDIVHGHAGPGRARAEPVGVRRRPHPAGSSRHARRRDRGRPPLRPGPGLRRTGHAPPRPRGPRVTGPTPRVLAVIPARGGSKGLPGKNIRPLAGLPLIAHSIRAAAAMPEVTRCIVTTDSTEIADVARAHGGDVPFLRPAELAADNTPMAPVVRARPRERSRRRRAGPTTPCCCSTRPARPGCPAQLAEAVRRCLERPRAGRGRQRLRADVQPGVGRGAARRRPAGALRGTSRPAPASPAARTSTRFLRINGNFYLWRADVRAPPRGTRGSTRARTAGSRSRRRRPSRSTTSTSSGSSRPSSPPGSSRLPWIDEATRMIGGP